MLYFFKWYREIESGTFFMFALKSDLSFQERKILIHNIQTQARSLNICNVLCPEKAFKQVDLVRLGYSHAFIPDLTPQYISINFRSYENGLMLFRILYSIAQKIDIDVLEQMPVQVDQLSLIGSRYFNVLPCFKESLNVIQEITTQTSDGTNQTAASIGALAEMADELQREGLEPARELPQLARVGAGEHYLAQAVFGHQLM